MAVGACIRPLLVVVEAAWSLEQRVISLQVTLLRARLDKVNDAHERATDELASRDEQLSALRQSREQTGNQLSLFKVTLRYITLYDITLRYIAS